MKQNEILSHEPGKKERFLGKTECGGASLQYTVMLAGIALLGASSFRQVALNRIGLDKKSVDQYYLETANETAIALASQLLGNSTIIPTSNAFKLNNQAGFVSNGTWSLDGSGRLVVNSCLRPNKTAAAKTVFTNNNDYSHLSSCDPNAAATTTIKVNKLLSLKFSSFKSGEYENYALVDANTRAKLGSSTLNKQARLRFVETTKVCNFNDPTNQFACNVDHCKFMKPLRDSAGNTVYRQDGKVEVEPNELFSERMKLTTAPAQLAIQRVSEADPPAVRLYNFFDKAYENGRKNPFDT
ncbi:MAG: hypothetical protein HQK54_15525, partial [Oligoflexales bacterium]|nr:hypothetical protein [Oligoflexales bacterium]